LGSAYLHSHCSDASVSRYKQAVVWDGSMIANLSAFKTLHRRIADLNRALYVPA
jgi:hypothetical protein